MKTPVSHPRQRPLPHALVKCVAKGVGVWRGICDQKEEGPSAGEGLQEEGAFVLGSEDRRALPRVPGVLGAEKTHPNARPQRWVAGGLGAPSKAAS